MTTEILSTLNTNGSGLNLKQLALTLAQAETAPKIAALKAKAEADTVRLSAIGSVRTQLDSLGAALTGIASKPVLAVETGSSLVLPRVTDRTKLQTGTVPVDVQAIATRQVLEFQGFAAADSPLAAGTITLDFGSWDSATNATFTASATRSAETIDITAGMTLQDLADKLTEVSGLTARVLDKGDGTFSLGIVGETGAANGIRLSTTDVGLTDFDTTATNATRQVQAAGDARLTIDGITITRTSNTITDALPGMELELTGVASTQIAVTRDETTAKTNMTTLVGALNDTFALLKSVTQRGIGEDEVGALAGDSSMEAIAQSLRNLIARPMVGHGDKSISLAEMGVVTNRDGSLTLDATAFSDAFALRATEFDGLFTTTFKPLEDGIKVAGLPGSDFSSGDYKFSIRADGTTSLGPHNLLGLDLGDGRRTFVGTSAAVQGLSITVDAGVTGGTIRYGQSFISSLASVLDVTADALLGSRETAITSRSAETEASIDTLEARAAILEKRYISRFAAMEQTITSMKSTGNYIQSMVDLWSQND